MSKSPGRRSRSWSALGGQIFAQISGAAGGPAVIPDAQILPKPSLDLSNPEIWITPKWEQAADLQITAADMGYAVDALVDGAYATDYYTGGDKIDLRIIGEEQYAKSSQSLASLPVATPTGQLVPLEAVADVAIRSGPEQINHRTRQRAITLQVTPPPEMPLEAAMDAIQEQVIAPMQASGQLQGATASPWPARPTSCSSTWISLSWNLALAVLITYLLMAATFESWVYPFVVIMTVPLGAVGGFAGLWLLNLWMPQPLDVLTMLGFIMLVGTVVNNPILIVEQSLVHCQRRRHADRPGGDRKRADAHPADLHDDAGRSGRPVAAGARPRRGERAVSRDRRRAAGRPVDLDGRDAGLCAVPLEPDDGVPGLGLGRLFGRRHAVEQVPEAQLVDEDTEEMLPEISVQAKGVRV